MRQESISRNLLVYEQEARSKGFHLIAGVDEAGRGPLAGPVVAAACIIPYGVIIEGVDDSKALSAEKREHLYQRLTGDSSICYAIGIISSVVIDQINILQATFLAMLEAVKGLAKQPDYVLVDGNLTPRFPMPAKAIIDGDALSQSIGAASIIAKVTRDKMMEEYAAKYPHFGFSKHKGYGTKGHLAEIARHGPTPIHRFSFSPIKKG